MWNRTSAYSGRGSVLPNSTKRTLMGCADPPSKGVGAPHQCSRVNKKRSGWGGVCHVPRIVRTRMCVVGFVSQAGTVVRGGCVRLGDIDGEQARHKTHHVVVQVPAITIVYTAFTLCRTFEKQSKGGGPGGWGIANSAHKHNR